MAPECARCPTSSTATAECDQSRTYQRHRPEASVLYGAVSAGLSGFLAERAERNTPAPAFVERSLRAYLRCGLLEHGFCRLRCDACGHELAVALSCKNRGFCPSCLGRRMNDGAAHLVDRVVPDVPIRQWVLSIPPALRILCAFRPEALTRTLHAFVRAVFAFQRRRARKRGLGVGRCGGITVVQRFGSACELNVHFHTLVFDGVYVDDATTGRLQFRPLPAPTAAELEGVTRAVARKARCVLRRAGLLDDQTLVDTANAQPELAGLIAESVSFPKGRVVDPRLARPPSVGHCGVDGFNLHAGVVIGARDSAGRERLCRYLLRPPVSDERLTRLDDGRVELALKTPWRDGTIALRFTPEQFVARLAALIPRPGKNLIRYHGVLAPGARGRSEIVPGPRAVADEGPGRGSTAHVSRPRSGRYLVWAELLRRVFEIDVLKCPTCGGRLRLVSVILDGLSARRYLTGASRVPEPAARPPPPQRDGRAAGAWT